MNLEDFNYRKEEIKVSEIFPKFDLKVLKEKFPKRVGDPHQNIFDLCLEMWDGGYDFILDNFGFYQKEYATFSGHCHQITPALGMVLKSWGLKVAYLECLRVYPDILEQVPPELEPNPDMKEEFCSIGRIPYCCLEVDIEGEKFYLTGKHLKRIDGEPKALLTPVCYRDFVGVFPHQDDSKKSGIYLDPVQDEPFVWKKQTERDPEPEYFKTFLYMDLILE